MDKNLRLDDFITRLDALGLRIDHEYKMNKIHEHNGYVTIDTKMFSDSNIVIRNFYTILGMYFHFESRSWAENLNWTFIVKSSLSFRFTDHETDSKQPH